MSRVQVLPLTTRGKEFLKGSFFGGGRQREGAACRSSMVSSDSHPERGQWWSDQHLFGGGAIFKATPTAYGGSQARGRIKATAAGLHHSHSNSGSIPCL